MMIAISGKKIFSQIAFMFRAKSLLQFNKKEEVWSRGQILKLKYQFLSDSDLKLK